MKTLKMQSHDVIGSNIEKIQQLFPNCVTETADKITTPDGIVRYESRLAIDFEKLQAELSNDILTEGEERYQFTWPDKRAANRLANTPTSMTLRPCREESVDFDTTQNLYIEGDNLDVLKVLRETYLGKVKMIYIDPPYNTGNDFVYNDDYSMSSEEFGVRNGFTDEDGNQTIDPMQRNTESNGRFHTDWLNMIYPRLKVARDLLSDDGVIFISIDDNEVENLKKVCNEVFGEMNFIAEFIWRGGRRNASKFISTSHEYMLAFAKSLNYCNAQNICWHEQKRGLQEIYEKAAYYVKQTNGNYQESSSLLKDWYKKLPETSESKSHAHYNWIDEVGVYFASDISRGGGGGPKWSITNPTTGNLVAIPARGWAYSTKEELENDIKNGLVHFNGDGVPCKKRYLRDNETQLKETVFYKDRRGAKIRLRNLLKGDIFDFPKDEEVLFSFIESFSDKTSIILDFFSGSATTAHAVMKLNAEDGGNRKFIMVQLPELTDEKSEAYKAGYKNICEIGKERIRRAGKKIKEEADLTAQNFDIGFRVLKLDSSNMEDVYYTPQEFDTQSLFNENVKADRTSEDLLFQVMLDLGMELSAKIETKQIAGKTVHFVDDNYLVACFDHEVNETTITEISKLHPVYFVMRDASASNDNVIDNFEQIFKHYSPNTNCRII